MKKLIIAMFAALAPVSVANAADVEMDFDGKTSENIVFTEIVKSEAASEPAGVLLPARPAPAFTPDQELAMDRAIASAIAYVRENNKGEYLASGFECLIKKGTTEEKSLFVYQAAGSVYSFPENCSTQNKGVCSWVVENVCKTVTYTACEWVCSNVGGPPAAGGTTQECRKECRQESKEDCKEVKNWVCS